MPAKATDPAVIQEALELLREGLSPQEAADKLRAEGKAISTRTVYRAREGQLVGQQREQLQRDGPRRPAAATPTGRGPQGLAAAAPAAPPAPSGPPLKPEMLSELTALVARLPLAQQDAILAAMPLEQLRTEAIARGLAPYPAAAAAVVREIQSVKP